MTEHDERVGRRLIWTGRVLVAIGLSLAGITAFLVVREWIGVDGWFPWSPVAALVTSLAAAALILLGYAVLKKGHEACHDTPSDFLEGEEENRVVEAIRAFERRTSGEIRVHLDYHSTGDPGGHAVTAFEGIGMTKTAERNGVLFFVAVQDHRFSVVGDEGIDLAVSPSFWEDVVAVVEREFAAGRYTEGLIAGIDMAGEALAEHFPHRDGDVNELPDDISRSTDAP